MNEFRKRGFALPLLGVIVLLGNAMEANRKKDSSPDVFCMPLVEIDSSNEVAKRSMAPKGGTQPWQRGSSETNLPAVRPAAVTDTRGPRIG